MLDSAEDQTRDLLENKASVVVAIEMCLSSKPA
jgi:hypothetical protein